MNFTKIALAAAVTLVAAQAQAATVYLSGASATSANYRTALTTLCTNAGGFAVTITNPADGNKFAVRCQTSSTNTTAKNFQGLAGIDAVTFNVGGGSFTAVTTSLGSQLDQFVVPSDTTGNTLTAPRKSEGGFLDIDAAAFPAAEYEAAGVGAAPTTTPASFAQVFGVAVSPALYTALQTAQGLAGCGIDSLTAACQPSLSKAQYVSIINDSLNTAKQDINATLSVGAAGDLLTLCRRVSTSGTQASSNQYFLNTYIGGDGTVGGAATPADAANFSSAATGLTSFDVNEGQGTANTRACLSGAGFAIGVLSIENYPDLTTRSGGQRADRKWRYVKINGVAAFNSATNSTETAKAGQYDFWFISQKYGHTANGTAVVNAIDNALGTVDRPGLFSLSASQAKRDNNVSPIRFD